jgi:transposase-like protein
MGQGRRHFTDEFKREAVALLVSSGRPLSRVAGELGIAPSMLRNWRNGSEGRDAGLARHPIPASAPHPAGDPAAEISRLRGRPRTADQCEDRPHAASGGSGLVTALRAPAIKQLAAEGGPLQPSLFDDRDMAEITSPNYPGERLVVCRNPLLADERARKRAELLAVTENELGRIEARVQRAHRPLRRGRAPTEAAQFAWGTTSIEFTNTSVSLEPETVTTTVKLTNAVTLKPTFMGMSVDLPKAWTWAKEKWRSTRSARFSNGLMRRAPRDTSPAHPSEGGGIWWRAQPYTLPPQAGLPRRRLEKLWRREAQFRFRCWSKADSSQNQRQ